MRKFTKVLAVVAALAVAFTFTGCGKKEEPKKDAKATEAKKDDKKDAEKKDDKAASEKIVIGVSPAPHGEIIEHLQPEFKKEGLDVEIKTFDDYILPNEALNDGDLDANYFQHKPYLEQFDKDHNMKLVSIGGVHIEPMGFYSKKYKSVDELKDGDEILVPNDPSNEGRALLLLQSKGLIKLKDPKNLSSTEKDIVENPKNLKITPTDAPLIASAYVDVAGGIINSNFVITNGIDPKTALFQEGKDSPYVNIVAVKEENKDEPKFKKLMKVLHSDACKKFIEEKYKGQVVPAFTDN